MIKSALLRMLTAVTLGALLMAACGGSGDPSAGTTTTTTSPEDTDFSDLGELPDEKVQPADVDWGDLDLTDQRLFTVMAEIDETFRARAADIWSADYRFDQTPFTVAFRDEQGEVTKVYVFHHPDGASLRGSKRVDLDPSLGLGDVYSIAVPDSVSRLPDTVPFDFDVDVGDASTMLFFIQEGDPFSAPGTWEFARFVVHETFHRHQLVDARWSEEFPEGLDYPRSSQNAALALLEDRILAAMTDSDDRDEIEQRLRQFLAVRQVREDAEDLGNLEPVQELVEGMARYVENRYAEVNGRVGRWATPDAPVSLDWLEFGRFYDTGSQIGWALDELEVEWKEPAAAGTSPVEVARESFAPSDPAGLVPDAKEEFDYETLLEEVDEADLENAESMAPGVSGAEEIGAGDEEEIVACLVEQGLPVDPSKSLDDALNEFLGGSATSPPEVEEALEACGIIHVGGAP